MDIIVLITTKNVSQANKIARKLLDEKLIACANILKGVQSLFWWQGKIEHSNEVLLILKTRRRCFQNIVSTVKVLHSYEVPEIIALPIVDGYDKYLKWLSQSVGG